MEMLSCFSPQLFNTLTCVGPFQHQPPTVQMSAVTQRWEGFLKDKRQFYYMHSIHAFSQSGILIKTEWQNVWITAWESDRNGFTHLGVLLCEKVHESKATVSSTNSFLWQADSLQLPKCTREERQKWACWSTIPNLNWANTLEPKHYVLGRTVHISKI